MNDIVIDTNVLLHADNKNNNYHQSAIDTLNLIEKADLYIYMCRCCFYYGFKKHQRNRT